MVQDSQDPSPDIAESGSGKYLSQESDCSLTCVLVPRWIDCNIAEQLADSPLKQLPLMTWRFANKDVEICKLTFRHKSLCSTEGDVPETLLFRSEGVLEAFRKFFTILHHGVEVLNPCLHNANNLLSGLLNVLEPSKKAIKVELDHTRNLYETGSHAAESRSDRCS